MPPQSSAKEFSGPCEYQRQRGYTLLLPLPAPETLFWVCTHEPEKDFKVHKFHSHQKKKKKNRMDFISRHWVLCFCPVRFIYSYFKDHTPKMKEFLLSFFVSVSFWFKRAQCVTMKWANFLVLFSHYFCFLNLKLSLNLFFELKDICLVPKILLVLWLIFQTRNQNVNKSKVVMYRRIRMASWTQSKEQKGFWMLNCICLPFISTLEFSFWRE